MNIDSWKEYELGDLCSIDNGKGITIEEIEENPGNLEAIQSGEENNGCLGTISLDYVIESKYTYCLGPCITVARSGSAGFASFHEYGCVAGDSAKIIKLKENYPQSREIYLFLTTLLKANQFKYSYGRKVTKEKYQKTTLRLPVDEEGNPDWAYMEEFIKEREREYRTNNCSGQLFVIEKWKEFLIKELFEEIYRSKSYVKSQLVVSKEKNEKQIPLVSRTKYNNGCDCEVVLESEFEIEKGNAITIGDTTATINYQPDEFITGDHIVVCRSTWMNQYTGLFIVTLLNLEKYRYSYGRAYTLELIKNTTIRLPEINGKPDWKLMENIIKSIPNGDLIAH